MSYVINMFNHYGYLVLFINLLLELIAFPLPGEALMTYCGYLIYLNKMSWPISVLVAALGAMAGITISYFVGRVLGVKFFEKHGHYVHLDKKRIDKISTWFQSYGRKLLIMAFFIPGVRHVTGYFSGMTKISYKKFAVNAYAGALIWTFTFISLGKVLGSNWDKYHSLITRYFVIISLIIAAIVAGVYIYRNYKEKIQEWTLTALKNGLKIFRSLGRIKVLIAGISAVFLVFLVLAVGIIQDYLANEFGKFDEVARYMVTGIFPQNVRGVMTAFQNMSNAYVLLIAAILTAVFIAYKGEHKLHEIIFLIISCFGAEGLDVVLKQIFRRHGPSGAIYTFPSGEALLSVVVYGFFAYILIKLNKKAWINSVVITLYLILCFIIGLSLVYFNTQYPSDVAAGYEFGIVWLTLSIILMEVYRVLPEIG